MNRRGSAARPPSGGFVLSIAQRANYRARASGRASPARTAVNDRQYLSVTAELAERAEVHEISQGLEICGDESAYSTNERDTNTTRLSGREGSLG